MARKAGRSAWSFLFIHPSLELADHTLSGRHTGCLDHSCSGMGWGLNSDPPSHTARMSSYSKLRHQPSLKAVLSPQSTC